MLLRDKSDGSMWATNDTVLTTEEAKAADITASFVTLTAMDSGTERLYIWPYFADLAFEVLDPDYKMDEPEAPTLFPEIEAADLMTARTLAEEVGKQAGAARLAAVGASPLSIVPAAQDILDVTPINVVREKLDAQHTRLLETCRGKTPEEITDILSAEYGYDFTLAEDLISEKQLTYPQAEQIFKTIAERRKT